ncbi:MAG: autotransporter-associated beta strand repeat-containing protein [Kiritimatiellia bacterium]
MKGGGSITSGGSTLTVNRDISAGFSYVAGGTDVAFNGATIVDNGGGAVNLVKTGGGKLRITTANPYTGTTTISQGSIELGNTSGLGNTTSAITLNDAKTSYFTAALYLQTGNTLTRDITVANAGFTAPILGSLEAGTGAFNGTITLNKGVRLENIAGSTMTVNGAVGGTGTVSKGGAGTFILAAVNGYTGGTVVNGGVLQAASVADGGTGNIGPYSSGGGAYLAIANGTFRYSGSGTESTARYLWIDQGPGTIDVTNASANLRFTGTGGALSQNVTKTGAGTLLLADDITGAAGVTAGGGTLILTGGNGYSGATAINSGVLQIGDGGATGTLGAGAVTDNAALVIKRSNALTIATGITGSGTLSQSGAGTTTLTGANTYAGTTYVSQGSLIIDGSTASAGLIDVSAGATLGGGGSGGAVSVANDGIFSPGGLDNEIAVTGLSLAANAILKFDLDDPVSPFWNDTAVIGAGALMLDGRLQVGPQAGAPGYDFSTAPAGTKWLLMTYAGSITDNGVTVESAPALAPGLAYAVDSTSTPGSVFLAVVPEAGSGALTLLGLLVLLKRRSPPAP